MSRSEFRETADHAQSAVAHDGPAPWWAAPPHQIRSEDLDRLHGAIRRGAGIVETVAHGLAA